MQNPPMTEATEIKPGQLWARLQRASTHGHASGALVPLHTTYDIVEDGGIRFQLRLLESLQQKDAAKAIQVASKESPRPPKNPFLPYDKDLFVGDISPTHAVVLNKYKVIDHHMLLITRDYHPQTELLTQADFQAMVLCLEEIDGLAFYNGGEEAGSSQPHKHLQVVPLPMTPDPHEPAIPIGPLLQSHLNAPKAPSNEVTTHPTLPFLHAFQSMQETWALPLQDRIQRWFHAYHALLRAVGLWKQDTPPSGPQPGPYNLLATRQWIMLVPRSQEFYQRISVNALGFAGGLLVRTPEDLALIKDTGPLQILRYVGVQAV